MTENIEPSNNVLEPLSERQRAIFEFLVKYIEENNYSPSMREISKAAGLSSTSSTKYQITNLIKLGYLSQENNKSRTLIPTETALKTIGKETPLTENTSSKEDKLSLSKVITLPVGADTDEDTTPVPLLGNIAAGQPILADDTVEDVLSLPRQLTGFGEFFMLTVVGESMIDAAICPGDKLVVRKQNTANDGEIVVALLEDEATVKVLSHVDGHRWLLPRNENYTPIPGDEALILGKVVTVLRTL